MRSNGAVRVSAFLLVFVITVRNLRLAFEQAPDVQFVNDTPTTLRMKKESNALEEKFPLITDDQLPMANMTFRNISSVFAYSRGGARRQQHNYYTSLSPVIKLMKIFVYDDLPKEFVSDMETYMYNKYVNESAELNIKADLAMIELFRTYPGRTWDPNEADIFFVPYPHASHCYYNGEGKGCDKVKNMGKLIRALTYKTEHNKERHLFMTLQDHSHIAFRLRDMTHFKLVTGPRLQHSKHGVIVVPTFNDAPRFQPSVIASRSGDWWTRPRKYAFCYYYAERHHGLKKSPNATRRFRGYFNNDIRKRYSQKKPYILGNMPFLNVKMGHGERDWPSIKQEALEAYESSIFCPVLAGDVAWQGRFFDVIMSGCLPVVLSWKIDNGTSWFVPQYNTRPSTSSIQNSYPFAHDVFHGDTEVELDYESFVVQAPGNETDERDVSRILQIMEDLLLNQPEEIRRRQLLMKEAAVGLTYGLGGDAHRYNDAFARIIRSLQHHVDTCFGSTNPNAARNC